MKIVNYINDKNIRKDVEPLFLSSFPESERPGPDIFFSSFKKESNVLYAFYDNDKFIGFTSLIIYKDIAYIFFLAVSPIYQHQGYGSQILSTIKNTYKDKVILLCYEEVDNKYDDYEKRKKRESFYKKNGFISNNLTTEEFGVVFTVARYGYREVSFEEYKKIFIFGFGEFAKDYIKRVE